MAKKKGVKIYLVSGTRIPKFIKIQNLNVSVKRRKIKKVLVRILTIKGGKADFLPGGVVGVIMPGSDQFWAAFAPLKVLKITDLKDKTIKDNYYLCKECFTNTGVMTSQKKSDIIMRFDADFQCPDCGQKWEHKRI